MFDYRLCKNMSRMMEAKRFSDIVGLIYDCVPEPSGWQNVLRILTEEFRGIIATLAVLDINTRTSRFGAAHGDPRIVDPLVTTYAAHMPFYDLVARIDTDEPQTFAALCALHGPNGREVLHSSRMWQEWCIPNRISEGLCINILKTGQRVGALVINVAEDRPEIAPEELETFALIAPHVRRAVTIGDLFELGRQRSDLFRRTIDGLNAAVLIVGDTLELRYANAAGEALLAGADRALSVSNGRLSISDGRCHRALEDIVAIGLRDEASLGGRGIGLPLPGPVPRIAHVLPLRRRQHGVPFSDDSAAAIFIASPGASMEPEIDAIGALFGLTAAERRVAAQVAQGLNRQGIASAGKVSDGTVKSQLDAIFGKTGTSNQRELEKLIRDLTPPLRRG
ncbi:MAG: hypothetical protein LCH46_14725 [Proteobacteria bacterium]|nr:hypothetical protein [Pseudomonadota bacterium]